MLLGSSQKITITPPIGLRMSGFSERDHGSEGILNELYANILVLGDGKTKAAIVTLDLIGVDKALTHRVREVVSQNSDIPYHAVLLSASHTHSGPEACRFGDMGKISRRIDPTPVDSAYNTVLPELIANGILWANRTLQPVKLGVKQSELHGLGSNRIDDKLYMDNTVTVFRVDTVDGHPLAVLTNYTCHPTILNFNNYLYSGDFVSFYQEAIEKVYPGCVAMYAQGCAGNVSTRHNRKGQGVDEAKRMGELLAGHVISTLNQVDLSDDYPLYAAIEPLHLNIRQFDSDEVIEQRIKDIEAKIERLKAENAPINIQRTATVEWQGATRNFKLKQNIDIDHIDVEMQRLDIGPWTIITTPAETFGEIGRDIRALDPTGRTIVTGYSNGYVGYIPTAQAFREAQGYEIGVAIVEEHSEDRLIRVAKTLLHNK